MDSSLNCSPYRRPVNPTPYWYRLCKAKTNIYHLYATNIRNYKIVKSYGKPHQWRQIKMIAWNSAILVKIVCLKLFSYHAENSACIYIYWPFLWTIIYDSENFHVSSKISVFSRKHRCRNIWKCVCYHWKQEKYLLRQNCLRTTKGFIIKN
jgi:hypothetical protein